MMIDDVSYFRRTQRMFENLQSMIKLQVVFQVVAQGAKVLYCPAKKKGKWSHLEREKREAPLH